MFYTDCFTSKWSLNKHMPGVISPGQIPAPVNAEHHQTYETTAVNLAEKESLLLTYDEPQTFVMKVCLVGKTKELQWAGLQSINLDNMNCFYVCAFCSFSELLKH